MQSGYLLECRFSFDKFGLSFLTIPQGHYFHSLNGKRIDSLSKYYKSKQCYIVLDHSNFRLKIKRRDVYKYTDDMNSHGNKMKVNKHSNQMKRSISIQKYLKEGLY